jgi:hypothetical protein
MAYRRGNRRDAYHVLGYSCAARDTHRLIGTVNVGDHLESADLLDNVLS